MLIIKSSERVQLKGEDSPYKVKMELQRKLIEWARQYPDLEFDNRENIRIELFREKSGHCTLQLHLCLEDTDANRRYLNSVGIENLTASERGRGSPPG